MEGDLQVILGQNLRRLREARGVSQEDFAESLGLHRTYIGGVERGERNLTLRSVERIADQLGMPAVDLLASSLKRRR
jgi:transcriptional regulator with XRE-family HTH domain